jgi:hypothetical protein
MSAERKTTANGRPNPKYVDLLDEDPVISGQKFVCVSFVSPEKIIKQREQFMFEKFVRRWELAKSMEKFQEFVNFVSFKYSLDVQSVQADLAEFIKEEEQKMKADASQFYGDYKTFVENNEEAITQEFNRAHEFQTSVRGIKVRGAFSSQEEAEANCKRIRERDPHHDIFVAPMGLWLPWDPDAYKTGKVEHLEPELNRLMQEKTENEMRAKAEFDERVKAAKRKAIEENIRKAKESGNKLTQTIDENGSLVGANTLDMSDREVADPDEREKVFKEAEERAAAKAAAPAAAPH